MAKTNHFSKKMISKSNSELQNYIDNKQEFQEDAILAAVWELEKRNKLDDKATEIENEINQSRIDETKRIEKEQKDSGITDDPNAPRLFNSNYIFAYGFLFSVFFGSILMALNFSRIGKKKTAWLTVFSGFIYSTIQVIIIDITNTLGLTMVFSLIGMFILEAGFWKKNKPSNLKFRKRQICGSLLIAIIFWLPIIYVGIISRE